MLLPNCDNAHVPLEKLTGYLLSEAHAIGKAKAKYFRAHGYDEHTVHLLQQGLLRIAREEAVDEVEATPHGTKYVIMGTLQTPRGTIIRICTVWIIEAGMDQPRFVTAYPG